MYVYIALVTPVVDSFQRGPFYRYMYRRRCGGIGLLKAVQFIFERFDRFGECDELGLK